MEYIQQTIDSNKLIGLFDLPVSLRSKTVQIIILPMQAETETVSIEKSSFGALSEYASPSLINQEEGAWERAVVEKYANN